MVTEKKQMYWLRVSGFLTLLLLLMSGCSSISSFGLDGGYILTYTRVPYTEDLNNTPVVDTNSDGIVIKIQEPFSGTGMYAEFNTNAIGDLAKKKNMKKLYFADLETFDLLGIWRWKKLYLYGE